MANVLTVVWFVIAYVLAQTSLMFWAAMMFPARVERARERVENRPAKCFFSGLLVWGLHFLVAMAFIKEGNPGPLQLFGWITLAPMLAGSVLGGGAFAEIVAERIRQRSGSTAVVPTLLGGALATTLGGLMPVIGWFVFFPLVSFIAVGAGYPALFRPRQPKKAAVQDARLEEFAPVASAGAPTVPAGLTVSTASGPAAYEGSEFTAPGSFSSHA